MSAPLRLSSVLRYSGLRRREWVRLVTQDWHIDDLPVNRECRHRLRVRDTAETPGRCWVRDRTRQCDWPPCLGRAHTRREVVNQRHLRAPAFTYGNAGRNSSMARPCKP